MKPVIAYIRVSTDDKGQDPERQRAPLEQRAAADRLAIKAWVVDEGTSAGERALPTFDRPKVKEALRLAEEHGAQAILVESVDRWTRKGTEELGYSMFSLRRDYGLELLFADIPDDPLIREVLPPIFAWLARLDNQRRSDLARTSSARRKKHNPRGCDYCEKGVWCPTARDGRPPKAGFSPEEEALAVKMHADGAGARRIALAISELRHAHKVADPRARRARTVSEWWVRTNFYCRFREESPGVSSRVDEPEADDPRGNGAVSSQGAAA